MFKSIIGAFVETGPAKPEGQIDQSGLPADEIDYTKPIKPNMSIRPHPQVVAMAANEARRAEDRQQEAALAAVGENVVEIQKKLSKVAYGGNLGLTIFKTLYDSLSMLPAEVRVQATISAAAAQGHDKANILKALESAGVQLEALEKDFLSELGNTERREISARQSRMEQIESQLVRLKQELQQLEDEKQSAVMEIGEKQRKFSEKRASYEVASKNVEDEINGLRSSLMKVQ